MVGLQAMKLHATSVTPVNVTILSGDLNGDDNSNVRSNEPTRAET